MCTRDVKICSLVQLECIGVAGFFTVVMMLPALAHSIFKCLSGFVMNAQAWCPNNVGKYAHIMKVVDILLGMSIKCIQVAEESCTTLECRHNEGS